MSVSPASPDNEAIRQLRDNTKELNETIKAEIRSTKRFSLAFLAFGLSQFVIGTIAVAVDVMDEKYAWPRIVLFVFGIMLCVYVFRQILSEENLNRDV